MTPATSPAARTSCGPTERPPVRCRRCEEFPPRSRAGAVDRGRRTVGLREVLAAATDGRTGPSERRHPGGRRHDRHLGVGAVRDVHHSVTRRSATCSSDRRTTSCPTCPLAPTSGWRRVARPRGQTWRTPGRPRDRPPSPRTSPENSPGASSSVPPSARRWRPVRRWWWPTSRRP
jgi:hypothetical protein